MPGLKLILNGDGAFPDLQPADLGEVSAIARLPGGMASGKSSVCIEITLPDGRKVHGQTSQALLDNAARCFAARDEFEAGQAGKTNPH